MSKQDMKKAYRYYRQVGDNEAAKEVAYAYYFAFGGEII